MELFVAQYCHPVAGREHTIVETQGTFFTHCFEEQIHLFFLYSGECLDTVMTYGTEERMVRT